MHTHTHDRGFTLVEMVVASAIITLFLLALIGVVNTYIRSSLNNVPVTAGAYMAEEGIEAVKYLRAYSWSAKIAPLSTSAAYYLSWQGGMWTVTTTPSMIDSTYLRTVTIGAVSRDASNNIVTAGGTNDPNTRKVTATVAWQNRGATTTQSLSTYITNLDAN